MSKVIVPKNYVYTHDITVSGITASAVLGSTYTTNFQLHPEIDAGMLGLNVTIDYGMSSNIVRYNWTSSTYRIITIKNSYPFGCNFIILTVKNLPKITNTGTLSGGVILRLALNDNTYITLLTNSVAVGSTLTIPNQTYYVDLVNNTASTDASSLTYNYNKAVIPENSYWWAPEETYISNSNTTSYTITPKNPHPYIFNYIEFRGSGYPNNLTAVSITSSTNVVININTSNNPSYIFLRVAGLSKFKNTSTSAVSLNIYVNISGTRILIQSDTLQPGFEVEVGTAYVLCIDVINKKLIYRRNTSDPDRVKAITHL